jgi:hypothetical protein
MHLSRLYTTALLRLPKTPYTMEGFEPGSPVPETNSMSTAPCRHTGLIKITI